MYPPGAAELRRHRGFWAVRTAQNPTFCWGNFLQFDAAPRAADVERWPALFEQHIASRQPGTTHLALCWEGDAQGCVGDFMDRGWSYLETVVMVATAAAAVAEPPAVAATLRAMDGNADWQALAEFNLRTRDEAYASAGCTAFTDLRVAHWRAQCEAGAAVWVGAWVGGELAAVLGLHAEADAAADGTRLARYQEVTTDARWRRRGLCSALLAHAAQALAARPAIDRYVIVADAHDVARRVYAARGFLVVGSWRGLLRLRPAAAHQASVETASGQW